MAYLKSTGPAVATTPGRTTVASYLITRLKQCGLEHLFAVPGDYASPFLETLDVTPGIERIATINELGSGYAADGYARLRGIGAACVQYGVGTFSLLNCTAGSFVERVPVVVISASPKHSNRWLERHRQVLFHHSTGDLEADRDVFEHATVASEILDSAEEAPAQIDGAITAMLTYRRPIYLEGLNDVWSMTCPEPEGRLEPLPLVSDPDSLAAAVAEAWARIQAAALPVIWAGVEAQRFGLQSLLQELVDLSGMPFTTTSLGKTVLDESQRQFIGTYAGPASPAITRAVMAASDCPVALGTIITDDYLDITKESFGRMVESTDMETRIGYGYYQDVTLPDFLNALVAKYRAAGAPPRAYAMPAVPPDPPANESPDPDMLTYNRFYDVLSGFLKADGREQSSVLVLGESTSLYVFGNLFGLPANGFVAQAAWGSLGHETGCALGVALATGKRPYVVAGDGGFMMICQELSSMAMQKCNAVVFVMSNRAYAIEQAFVDIDAFKPEGEFAPFDLLPAWDYRALALAFGAQGWTVRTIEELEQALAEIDTLEGVPALVEVVIPQKDLAPQLERLATTP